MYWIIKRGIINERNPGFFRIGRFFFEYNVTISLFSSAKSDTYPIKYASGERT